jgi:RNA polymerase sigma factor (sigma-70 family)
MLKSTQAADELKSTSHCSLLPRVSDEDVLLAIAGGATWALELLYQRYHQMLYAVAYKMVIDHQIAENLLQEALPSVWRQATTYSAQAGTVYSWLFAILRHRTIDYLRKMRRRVPLQEVPLWEIESDESVASSDPWEEVWQREKQAHLREALMQLPKKQRRVLELSYFQGWTHGEIAKICDMPLGTVKSCIRQGLLHLKRLLEPIGVRER